MIDKDVADPKNSQKNTESALSQQTDPQVLKSETVSEKKFSAHHFNIKKINSIFLFLGVLFTIWFVWPLWKNFLPQQLQSSVSKILDVGRLDPNQLHIATLREKIEAVEFNNNVINEEFRKHVNSLSNQSSKLTTIERRLADLAVGNDYEKLIKQITEEQKRLKFAQEKLIALFSNAGLSYGIPEIKIRLQRLEELAKKNLNRKNFTPGRLYLSEEINKRLKVLEAENEQLSKTVAALQNRIMIEETQETRSPQTPDKLNSAGILMLAFVQLKAAATTGKGFQEEWAAVSTLAANDRDLTLALNMMRPFMKNGAPTLNLLRQEFSSVADKISQISSIAEPDGWISATIEKISTLITIRRKSTNLEAKNRFLSPIDQVEIFLSNGNLNSAITVVEGFSGKIKNIAAFWLSRARARASINKGLKEAQMILLSISGMRPGG